MNYQYKIIISNHSLYKEFEIPADMERVKLGTTSGCEFRLNPDFFFEAIEVEFEKNNQWYLRCQDNLYISRGDILKLFHTKLEHGESLNIYYSQSGETAFEVRFMIDFEAEMPKYNWKIDILNKEKILISDKTGADIELKGRFSQKNSIIIGPTSKGIAVTEEYSQYGVYVNGKRINKTTLISDCDFVSVADFSCYFCNGALHFDKKNVKVNNNTITSLDKGMDDCYPMFVRNTRIKSKIDEKAIKILDPDTIPTKPELNLVTSLMPTLVMFALVVVFRGIMSSTGGSYVILSICSMGLGVITSILNIVNTQKKYKKECKERKDTYETYIEKKRKEIIDVRQKELDCLKETYLSTEDDLRNIEKFDANLFDRVPEDEDFLEIYLGIGEREAKKKIDYKEQEKLETGDDLCQIPGKLSEEFKYIKNAPITISLKNANAIGVVGNKEYLYQMLKCFIVDIISRHYSGDVNLYAFLDKEGKEYDWMRLIPHIQGNGLYRNIVCDNESKNNIFEYLYKELTYRSEVKDVEGFNVILIMNDQGMKSHPISRFIGKASELNTVFVFFEELEELLPLHCSKMIDLKENNQGSVFECANKNEKQNFKYIEVTDERLARATEILAPIYCEEISLENSLRKNITLYELLGIYSVEDLNLRKRWSESEIYRTMQVPLGVNAKEDVVYLNLHEKFHGPHGLVAGTTGSGKSEILQSFILSAATYFHPYEIGFVIIDFKGGGMVNQFRDLPHLIGAITNIDGNEVQRSLKSIKAELMKRQNYFAAAGVNHIDKYIQLYKEGKVAEALPHLVIIVDEFAELKAEQPEFMKELISAARIGRSLGVHLILATQKPSGVVDAQIWSNSKFKLCLKVQSQADSNEVIKTPLAAEIKEPGRAYLQVGNNELFELFQSAYSGAPAAVDASEINKEFTINQVGFTGIRKPVYMRKKQKQTLSNSKNQLEAIVECVQQYCEKAGIEKLPDICLPPLPEILAYKKAKKMQTEALYAIIGLLDDPEHQKQDKLLLNVTDKNYMIVGSGQTGKTTVLQTMIRSLAENYSPEELNMYIIDFGSMILRNFSKLNQVGGVVCSFEDEKLKSLFRMLKQEIAYRKTKLAESGVSSFIAYKEAGMKDLPQIILFVDNLTALKEMYFQEEDLLLPLTRDGVAVGISVVVANAQTTGIGYKYLNNFEGRMTMFCNETSEYGMMFEGNRMKLPNVPGRALIQREKVVYESQIYVPFEGEREVDRVRFIKEFIEECNSNYRGMNAKIIPEIPKALSVDYMKTNYPAANRDNKLMLGLDFATIAPINLNMSETPMLVLSGRKDSGKDIFAKYIVSMMMENTFGNVEFYILDDVSGKWADYEFHQNTVYYSTTSDVASSMVGEISQIAKERYERLATKQISNLNEDAWLVLLIESEEAILQMSADKTLMASMKNILGKYSGLKIIVLLTNIENTNIAYNAPDMMKVVKEQKRYVIFEDIKNIKLCDISTSLAKKYTKELETSDAFYINDNELKKIRTIQ